MSDDDRRHAGGSGAGQPDLEAALLGGARRHTRLEVAQESGLPDEIGQRLWRALGFPDVADDAVMFTDGDVEALRDVRLLAEDLQVPVETSISIARTMAQSAARLAATEVAAMSRIARDQAEQGVSPDVLAERAGRSVEVLERLLAHVWRRHLAAAAGRLLDVDAEGLDAEGDVGCSVGRTRRMAVGFADLVGFTTLSRRVTDDELVMLVDRFETQTADLIAGLGGQLVKTIGDEVMFTHDDPAGAVQVALELIAVHDADEDLPPVRAGVAFGSVTLRHGGVYGPVVNIAARLTSSARPGTLLVDRGAHEALGDDDRFAQKGLKPKRVRGYNHLATWAVKAADAG